MSDDGLPRVRAQALNHASFTVRDLDATAAFLVDVLGYRIVSRGPRDPTLIRRMTGVADADLEIMFLKGPGHRIELIRYMGPADRGAVNPRMCDTGAAHIGVDIVDLDGALDEAEAHGFHLAGEVIRIDAGPNAGRRVCYLRDGDGITVELLEVKGD